MHSDLIVPCTAQECYVNVLAYLHSRNLIRVNISAILDNPQANDIIVSVEALIDEGDLLHECMKIGIACYMSWLRPSKAPFTNTYVFHGLERVALTSARAKRFVC